MKTYKTDEPLWSDILDIFETTDRGHADIVNKPIIKLFENTLFLKQDSQKLQTEFENTIDNILSAGNNSVSVISEDGNTITTTYSDGTKMVAIMDDTSIIQEEYDAEGVLISKTGTYITDTAIETKELGIKDEE